MTKSNTVALFIDADNAPAKKISFILSELAVYGSVMVRKIYGNWKNQTLQSWENVLLEYALQPVQQFDYTKGKNATDMALTIDVMDLLYSNKIDVFCIVSSDCDFTPLAMRIKAEGKQVIGFGEQKTPMALVSACSKFLYLETNNNTGRDGFEKMDGTKLKCDTKLMNLLRDAIANSQDDNGWTYLGTIGQYINNQSSIDCKNYGYDKLSDLVRAIDLFETKMTNNNSQMYVRDKRKKA